MTTSEQIGIEHVAEHLPYSKQESGLLEITLAGLQQRLLWAIDLEREGMETQIVCMNRIEEISVVLDSRVEKLKEG